MIITRTPFRISFAGGGSDIESFYKKHNGCVVSTAIDKYMYIAIHPNFNREETILKYSKTEIINDRSQIEHTYFRKILESHKVNGVEIVSTADVLAGSGLGSSSTFTVGVLHALYAYEGKYVSKEKLASEACSIEIDDLKNPIGKQDQYAAAYGGLNCIRFYQNGDVNVEPILMPRKVQKRLESNLMLFYTGRLHSASEILGMQSENVTHGIKEQNQLKICQLAEALLDELRKGNIDSMGEVLHDSWLLKKTLALGISYTELDSIYDRAILAGAEGGKLLGAGGGGFMLFYVRQENQEAVRRAVQLPQMPFSFDRQGTTVIYVGEKPKFIVESNGLEKKSK